MSTVSLQDVRQIARLGRIELSDDQLAMFTGQLDEILGYVRQLQGVPTEGIEPTSHVLPLSNITRPDQIQPSIAPEAVLSIAPERHGPYIRVPKIVET
ncbi:MAG: Asp-tRNA(Asn)/Glu-tRNA(Gln) amidotransferase subunit GatC [Candidatus Omnitrophica bacterium]|nr:Asp-tRNA(Asn)/Glu-tRNA(Gln) amidotransferase subunit GatC [Candidatus Omnitrophota bacterium]